MENQPPPTHAPFARPHASMTGPSPRRPLSNLPANALITPIKPSLKRPPTTKSPLKRSAAAILDSSQGFTYLQKRRRVSPSPPPASRTAELRRSSSSDPPTDSTSSFTSLINYDPSSAVPRTVSTRKPPAPRPAAALVVPPTDALRLSLRMALYKVVTQQTHVPFSRVRILRGRKPGNGQWAVAMTSTPSAFGPMLAPGRQRSSSSEATIVNHEVDDSSSDEEDR